MAAVIVGISGGSAAGKSTFAAELGACIEDLAPVVLNQDAYFRDWEALDPERREAQRTSNHPRAVLWDELVGHVAALREGGVIELPVQGTQRHRRGDALQQLAADKVVLVEGHLLFSNAAVRGLCDLKIFMEVDAHERVLRRLLRDTGQEGVGLEAAVAWYRRDVLPNFPLHTEPTRRYADLVVPFDQGNQRAVDVVGAWIRSEVAAR